MTDTGADARELAPKEPAQPMTTTPTPEGLTDLHKKCLRLIEQRIEHAKFGAVPKDVQTAADVAMAMIEHLKGHSPTGQTPEGWRPIDAFPDSTKTKYVPSITRTLVAVNVLGQMYALDIPELPIAYPLRETHK